MQSHRLPSLIIYERVKQMTRKLIKRLTSSGGLYILSLISSIVTVVVYSQTRNLAYRDTGFIFVYVLLGLSFIKIVIEAIKQ